MKNLRAFEILDYLKKKKYCSMTELQKHFGISTATIHRDIAALVERSLVQKVHGGVAMPDAHENESQTPPSPFQERIWHNRADKEHISTQALGLIKSGDVIFLDSSTTVYYLAEELKRSSFANLTIITNSVLISQEFHDFPPHYVLMALGGTYDLQLNAFFGESALRELKHLTIGKAFVSAFGVKDGKASTNHEFHAEFLRDVLKVSAKKYLLADRSKYDRTGLFGLGGVSIFDKVIS